MERNFPSTGGPVQRELESMTCDDLRRMAKHNGLTGYSKMRKADLVAALMDAQ